MMEQPKIEQPKKEEAEKELFKHVKTVLDGALAKEGKYAHNQAKVYTISIEAFTKTHADELARLKRLNEIAEIYKSEFEKQKKAHPEKKDDRYWYRKAQGFIFSSVLTEQEKQELERSVKNEKDRQGAHLSFVPAAEYSLSSLLNEINKAKTEQPKIEQPQEKPKQTKRKPEEAKKEKAEKRGETTEKAKKWERATTSGVKSFIGERVRAIKTPDKKIYENLLGELEKGNYDKVLKHFEEILGEGIKWQVTDKATVYMGLYKQEQLRSFVYCLTGKEYEKRGKEIGPATYKEVSDYLKKEIERWGLKEENEPSVGYIKKAIEDKNFHALANEIDHTIAAEVRMDDKGKELENLRRYRKFLYDKLLLEEVSKTEEKPKKKEEPEKKPKEKKKEEKKKEKKEEKPLTLDEKIAQKKKELEEAEEKMAIYRPLGWFRKKPVVRDLGYYAGEAKIRDLKKELKELEKRRGKEPKKEKIPEPKTMPEEVPEAPTTKEQLEAVEKNLRSVYGKIGYRKRKIREGGVLGRADLEKNIAILEKERDRLKEMKKKIKERLAIEKRLKEIPEEIKKSGVLGRLALEKEEKRLEKKLKKLKK